MRLRWLSISARPLLRRVFRWMLLSSMLLTVLSLAPARAGTPPDHYKVGAYLLSIHHIDTAAGTFDADLWIWSIGSSSTRDPLQSMEFVNSENIDRRLQTSTRRGALYWRQAKIVGRFRQEWNLDDYPFDKQVLDIVMEEGADDAASLVYDADTIHAGHLPDASPRGWQITGMKVQSGTRHYSTDFGDPDGSDSGEYATLRLAVTLQRASFVPFLSMSAPLYAAFLLCSISFLLHLEGRALVEARIGLLAGALFALVLNMRSVSSLLGNVQHLTVFDRLHIVVLIDIVFATMVTIAAGIARDRGRRYSRRIDYAGCLILVLSFVAVNTWLISNAIKSSSSA